VYQPIEKWNEILSNERLTEIRDDVIDFNNLFIELIYDYSFELPVRNNRRGDLVMLPAIYCSDSLTKNNIIIDSLCEITLPTLYPRLYVKTQDFIYPDFGELILKLCDVKDGVINLELSDEALINIILFLSCFHHYVSSVNIFNGKFNISEFDDTYVKIILSTLEFLASRDYSVYYIDTDQMYVDASLFDNIVDMMMLKRIVFSLLGIDCDIEIDSNRYVFFGVKRYVIIKDSKGLRTLRTTNIVTANSLKNDLLNYIDKINVKFKGK
jgi:hypothetical protein